MAETRVIERRGVLALRRYRRMRRKMRTFLRKTKEHTSRVKLRLANKMHLGYLGRHVVDAPVAEPPTAPTRAATDGQGRDEDLFNKVYKFLPIYEGIRDAGMYFYFRTIESGQDTEVTIGGKRVIMIGSNNYLGLTADPRLKEAAKAAIDRFGPGCTGSRFLNGTLDIHVELEHRLAAFMQKEEALVYSTGFQTNLGIISSLVGKGDVILSDRMNHASIVDGCNLSFGKTYKYPHKNMDELERLLQRYQNAPGRLIIVDGLFSMEGDLAPLPQIVKLAKRYRARLMVDDAHAAGVYGAEGRGTPEHFGVSDDVDLIMYTFSKSFASVGGVVAASKDVICYLRHISRSLIFSASLPPASVAAVLKALDIIETEPWRRERLWAVTHRMHREYRRLGFDIGATVSPIIPIMIGDDHLTFKMTKRLMEEGVFVNPAVSPASPPGRALVRTGYTATHTDEQMDFVLDAFKKVGRELGVISAS